MCVSECGQEQILHLIRTVGEKSTVSVCTPCNVESLPTTSEHFSSHGDCNFDARLVSKTQKDQQSMVSEMLSERLSFTDSG